MTPADRASSVAPEPSLSRRSFLGHGAAVAASAPLLAHLPAATGAWARGNDTLRIGLIGCGGRGTGAAAQALRAKGDAKLWAMGDAFADRLQQSLGHLRDPENGVDARLDVTPERCFTGFDAYRQVIDSGVDVVLLATPPHFRPAHFAAAVAAGKHVFFEKPVAVDAPGVRTVLAASDAAQKQGLAVVCGLQRHHQLGYLDAVRRVQDGAIGDVIAARVYWNGGGLWMHRRRPSWSDMEWQMRNWLYFAWLSGDHIVEQHVHNLDVANWVKGMRPVRCFGMGGRQVRTDPAYGHIFDHHAVHYEYPDGTWLFSQCRQIDGCANEVAEHFHGSKGTCHTSSDGWSIERAGAQTWRYDGPRNDPYQTEHDDLFESIRAGKPLNEGRMVAESTRTAIMGRMATYGGKVVTWEQALASDERLGPDSYELASLPLPPVPMPGR